MIKNWKEYEKNGYCKSYVNFLKLNNNPKTTDYHFFIVDMEKKYFKSDRNYYKGWYENHITNFKDFHQFIDEQVNFILNLIY